MTLLHEAVRATAKRHPGRVAVSGVDGSLSYAELDRRADALAASFVAAGVVPGDRVLIWAAKSCAVVVAMQAALRAGAAYVPVDSTSPAGRVATVVRDCAPRVVCASPDRAEEIARFLEEMPVFCDLGDLPEAAAPVAVAGGEDDLAFILYTSGSTGTPKGVCLSHANAMAFVRWAIAELALGKEDRLANHAPFSFDLSVLDLYGALCTGGSVHLVAAELAYAPEQLVDFLRWREITVWYSVPSALLLMMRDGGLLDRPAPAALRAVLFAGEPFPIGALRDLAGWTGARLLNLYGPTETNVCTAHEVGEDDLARDRPVPIGTAVSGDTVWAVVDGEVARPGEAGELHVSGPSVMRGYWGREPQRDPYPTGDLVSVREDGSFEYLGRRDAMVKVRGHRVELGDVEAALTAHPDIAEAAAVVRGSALGGRIEAFVVPRPGARLGVLAVKRHCAERLPTYMIADDAHFVPALPRTANGKVDRAALAVRHPSNPKEGSTV
ncbi:amino acid adenylation domain-containing protein [Amycolatopsis sp. CA-230715]|uniref:amino acid adenylation domain-containing protein n=1 Tax=Amycolatopsis sp. CA-230715 TaxID=2745196 RepID=UPI001C3210B8|nr:amino acid adenylation domain-containing protein [Amycolatopsis sp. CA-230715]QWF82457.1 putative L-prolyl-AMP ligase PigI [Amycolatopsis sp. CA-230715]